MGSVILGLAVFLFGGGFLVRSVSHARNGGAWAGPQTGKMRSRSQAMPRAGLPAARPIRHEIKRIWAEAGAADWLEQRKHERANGTTSPAGTSPASTGPGRLRLRGRRLKAGAAGVIPPARQSRPGQPAPPPAGHAPAIPRRLRHPGQHRHPRTDHLEGTAPWHPALAAPRSSSRA